MPETEHAVEARQPRIRCRKGEVTRTEVIGVRVEPEIKEWIDANGGARFHYEMLRERYQNHLHNVQE